MRRPCPEPCEHVIHLPSPEVLSRKPGRHFRKSQPGQRNRDEFAVSRNSQGVVVRVAGVDDNGEVPCTQGTHLREYQSPPSIYGYLLC